MSATITMSERIIADTFERFFSKVHQTVKGCEKPVRDLAKAFLAGGDALMTGIPGLGKTLLGETWGMLFDCGFAAKTFVPDDMPSDVCGTVAPDLLERVMKDMFGLFDPDKSLVLADELNRTPPKVQNALLEVMNNRAFRIRGNTYVMKRPFFLMACRNPISNKGTYPVVEALLDRFYLETFFGYCSFDQAVQLSQDNAYQARNVVKEKNITPLIGRDEAAAMQDFVREKVTISVPTSQTLVRIVFATHPADLMFNSDGKLYDEFMPTQWKEKNLIRYGVSTRAIPMFTILAKANAVLDGRTVVTDDDVKAVAVSCLAHRLTLNEQLAMGLSMGTNRQIITDLVAGMKT